MKKRVQRRLYRQTARATATEATGERILNSFLRRFQTQWFDEITLDVVAKDAGVTIQTVLRRFGAKEQLLQATAEHLRKAIHARRAVDSGDVLRSVDVLAADYEAVGNLVWRVLAQEQRYPALKALAELGRAEHRQWLSEVFRPWLNELAPKARAARLDALFVATDLYVWKLVRRDLGRPVSTFKSIVRDMVRAALPGAESAMKDAQ